MKAGTHGGLDSLGFFERSWEAVYDEREPLLVFGKSFETVLDGGSERGGGGDVYHATRASGQFFLSGRPSAESKKVERLIT